MALERDDAKSSAAYILGRVPLGKHEKVVIEGLTKLLKDKESRVRITVIKSLGRISRTEFGEIDENYIRYYQGVVAKYDTNGDGVLTKDEWSKMETNPSPADQNSDGRITPAELARWRTIRGR